MGMATLETYLEEAGLTLDDFGRRIGVSAVTIHRWAKGKSRPSWTNVSLIEQATDGVVTAQDFVPAKRAATGPGDVQPEEAA